MRVALYVVLILLCIWMMCGTLLSLRAAGSMCGSATPLLPLEEWTKPSAAPQENRKHPQTETNNTNDQNQTQNTTFKMQTFVISMQSSKAKKCIQQNKFTGIPSFTFFQASNGFDQEVLDDWYFLTKTKLLNASAYAKGYKQGNENPHVVGCFLSHWNVLKLAISSYQALDTRPDAIMILEDDAACVDNLFDSLQEKIPMLPNDWDMYFVGGKPYSYMDKKFNYTTKIVWNESYPALFQDLACQGFFGKSSTGPFAPDGSRLLDLKDAYWKTGFMTNTHAYLVNPQRLEHVLEFLDALHKRQPYILPLDIRYANGFKNGYLNAYMTTEEYCYQKPRQISSNDQQRTPLLPSPWVGYYHHENWLSYQNHGFEWAPMYIENCTGRDEGIF
jgi:GR25 family glycosyltransferase involved in LPS biosynthesis